MSNELSSAERDAIRAAAQWYARLASGVHDERTYEQWQCWHATDPLHQQAWQRMEAVRKQMARVPGQLAADSLQDARHSRRQVLRGFVLLASASGLATLGWRSELGQSLAADYRTGVGEQRRFKLDDGSALMLDTASAVDVRYDGDQRRLLLRSGALWVETAADAQQRPFLVETPHGLVHALGTRFTVSTQASDSTVAVQEKAVEVTASHSPAIVRLEAGQQLTFSATELGQPRASDASVAAWTQGSLIVVNRPLGELIEELARYRHGWLRCDPRIAGIKVSGAFPLDDSDLALGALESGFPVQVIRRTRYWVTLVPRG